MSLPTFFCRAQGQWSPNALHHSIQLTGKLNPLEKKTRWLLKDKSEIRFPLVGGFSLLCSSPFFFLLSSGFLPFP
jgi:hypothetical protein